MNGLPEGWALARLEDACELVNGRAYKQPELLADGKYPVIRVGNFFSSQKWYYSDLELDENKYCNSGDLLYAWSASFGPKIWLGGKSIFHYHIWRIKLEPSVIDKKFLYHWFQWDKDNIKAEHGTGSTMIHVTKGDMEKRAIVLPPIAEQRRIVAKLDALTARTARARADLDRIPALAARYKQAVLAKAFAGKLGHNATARDWVLEPASVVCEKVQSGGTPKAGFQSEGIPFLKVYNVVGQQVDFEYRPQFVSSAVHYGELRKSIAHPGDVVMNIVGPPLGKVAVVPDDFSQWNLNQALTLFRPSERITTKWLYYFLCGGDSVQSVINETRGSAGQVNISLSQCRAFMIPVPPLEDQRRIVAQVERAFAEIDRLAAEAGSARRLLDRLDQTILAKAFRGELVPQDPADEPAGVLLDRVRAERAAAPKPARGRRKATA